MKTGTYLNLPRATGSDSTPPTRTGQPTPPFTPESTAESLDSSDDSLDTSASAPCPRCHGTYHYQDLKTAVWRRCPCIVPVLDRTYIVPSLRRRAGWSDAWLKEPPIPLRNWSATGSLPHFKAKCWRSLIAYEAQSLRYDYVRAERILDMWFGKDLTYPHVEATVGLGLLIVELPDYAVLNKYYGDVLRRVWTARQTEQRPTWLYVPGRVPAELQKVISLVSL